MRKTKKSNQKLIETMVENGFYKYRVECNFGSKYFDKADDAYNYFCYCSARDMNAQVWTVSYCYDAEQQRYIAIQFLMDSTNDI